ncbi:hypothetical protein V9L05_18860 [Bernardetia sp. Wsw4-3y2]|uniref:hypothetical protein n=1 Tax=Bernardetia sp. Wsw4-3y2 TaxID=3127471 RepID=UPI0030D62D67
MKDVNKKDLLDLVSCSWAEYEEANIKANTILPDIFIHQGNHKVEDNSNFGCLRTVRYLNEEEAIKKGLRLYKSMLLLQSMNKSI